MPTRLHPDEALHLLQDGNERWATDGEHAPRRGLDRIAEAAMGQFPFATVFTCADSRVPAELVFDQGVGDLFVVRTAGHVIDDAVRGTLAYGAHALRTPLIVVLGHTGCGAVTAAYKEQKVHADIVPVVARIAPAALSAPSVDDAVAAHVKHCVDILSPQLDPGVLCNVVGAVYDLATGQVRWL